MARIIIWPDLYKEQGHWLPCVNLAATLMQAGHTVEFMGIADCESILDPYKYGTSPTFHKILEDVYPLGYSLENKLEPKGQRWKPHHLLPMCRGEGGMAELFGTNPPDLIISGYFTGLESLIIHHKYGVPIATITTYLRHPDDDPAMHAKAKLEYFSRALSQRIIELSAGSTSPTTIDEFIAPLQPSPYVPTPLVELIPCVREFDFDDEDWVHRDNVHYVEPMITRVKLGGSFTDAPTRTPEITLQNSKVIFGTVGSQVQDYESKAKQFFKSLISMMSMPGMTGYDLVLAVGDRLLADLNVEYKIDRGAKYPDNIHVYSWVSQLEVLDTASVAFMHGGLATVKEAIWKQVPIVVVPQGKDQMDNALRISRKGLGLVAQEEETSPENFRKLLTAATSSTWISESLSKMKAVFAAAEEASPKPSLDALQGLLG